MKEYFKLLRIKHWIKNCLIFIPMICAFKLSEIFSTKIIYNVILGFLSFSLIASSIYIINDIKDAELDKLHERKKNRPIASGKVSKNKAIFLVIILLLISFAINYFIDKAIINTRSLILLIYFIINVLYSFGLKNMAIIDIVLLSAGFVLRVYFGGVLINVNISNWLFLTILNASLFLGFGKRRKEKLTNSKSRKVLEYYTENFLNQFYYLTLGLTIVFYSLWAIEQSNKYIVITIPLLMLIFMRYCLIVERTNEGDPTTILFQDKPLILTSILYVVLFGLIMVL